MVRGASVIGGSVVVVGASILGKLGYGGGKYGYRNISCRDMEHG